MFYYILFYYIIYFLLFFLLYFILLFHFSRKCRRTGVLTIQQFELSVIEKKTFATRIDSINSHGEIQFSYRVFRDGADRKSREKAASRRIQRVKFHWIVPSDQPSFLLHRFTNAISLPNSLLCSKLDRKFLFVSNFFLCRSFHQNVSYSLKLILVNINDLKQRGNYKLN